MLKFQFTWQQRGNALFSPFSRNFEIIILILITSERWKCQECTHLQFLPFPFIDSRFYILDARQEAPVAISPISWIPGSIFQIPDSIFQITVFIFRILDFYIQNSRFYVIYSTLYIINLILYSRFQIVYCKFQILYSRFQSWVKRLEMSKLQMFAVSPLHFQNGTALCLEIRLSPA